MDLSDFFQVFYHLTKISQRPRGDVIAHFEKAVALVCPKARRVTSDGKYIAARSIYRSSHRGDGVGDGKNGKYSTWNENPGNEIVAQVTKPTKRFANRPRGDS